MILGADTHHSEGAYGAYLSPYNAKLLRPGDTHAETLTFAPGALTRGSRLDWSYPDGYACPGGVWGYLAIIHGDDPVLVPQERVKPRQVKMLGQLVQAADLVLGGDPSDCNVVTEIILTALPGDHESPSFEVEIFLHMPPVTRAWADALPSLGTFHDAQGRFWQIRLVDGRTRATDILLYETSGADALTGSIDLKAMLLWLKACGLLTEAEWYTSHACGVEPIRGAGSLTYVNFGVAYG